MSVVKVCKECGKIIDNAKNGQKYHSECALIVRKRSNFGRKKRRAIRIEMSVKKPSVSIDEIIKRATAEGMQYGEYCTKYGIR